MKHLKTYLILMTAILLTLAACDASGGSEPSASDNGDATGEMDDPAAMDDDHHDDDEHRDGLDHTDDAGAMRIPNEGGSAITIVDPSGDIAVAQGEDIVIDVAVENFDLTVANSHWHIYVDGESYQMVSGGSTDAVLRNLEPGRHEVEVYIANGDHEEYADGDAIVVTIEE